jgi:hypothetical protein
MDLEINSINILYLEVVLVVGSNKSPYGLFHLSSPMKAILVIPPKFTSFHMGE